MNRDDSERRRGGVFGQGFMSGLSSRLLILTVAFLLLGEVLIFVPSIARFRLAFLDERLASAQLASLSLDATPDAMVSQDLAETLLSHAKVASITLQRPSGRELMLGAPMDTSATFDLRDTMPPTLIMNAFETMFTGRGRNIRIIGASRMDPGVLVDITLDETELCDAMLSYAGRILTLSIVLSLVVASLLYLTLQWLMVRPMRQIAENMQRFRRAPEDITQMIKPSPRHDEIGVVQRELAMMQASIRKALVQKTRLAALGAAVGKINHDLRNMLATALLNADRLERSEDPEVRRVVPPLIDSVERAVQLCTKSLGFTRADEQAPQRRRFALRDLVSDCFSALGVQPDQGVACVNEVPADIEVNADRDQLFRALFNLGRNAVEAMAASQPTRELGNELRVSARRGRSETVIEVVDTGPGLSARARDTLFQAFAASNKANGSGLGLAIARELVGAHGGSLELAHSDADGTAFRITLPDRAAAS